MKFITAILKFIFIIAFHLVSFICYPETGKYGDYYFWISIFIWTTVMLSISSNIKYIKLISFPVKIWINISLYLIMIFFIALTMPQRDGINVLTKIKNKKFPTSQDIETGKIKYMNYLMLKRANIDFERTFKNIKDASKILGDEK